MRSSYSQNNTYITCPQYWDWSYNKRLKSPEQSAALYFGSAVDDAIMANLDGKDNYMDVFYSRWTTARGYGNNPDIPLFDNLEVTYTSGDWDQDVMDDDSIQTMQSWVKQLRLTKLGSTPIEIFNHIKKNKKNPYKQKYISQSQEKYFSRCCWLSMKKKGEILIDSFIKHFKPKIKKVHATQIPGKYTNEKGDTIFGYLDFVAEIEGYDKPIIFDLKTAAKPYSQSKIDLTAQLTLYYAMAGEKYDTNLVGYVVLSKAINKNEKNICKKCGNIKTGKHRTCDFVDKNGSRCHGSWETKIELDPKVQVLVQEKTEEQKNNLILDYNNIMKAMKMNVIYKNYDKCNNWYGSQCPYYNACHNNDTSELIKK